MLKFWVNDSIVKKCMLLLFVLIMISSSSSISNANPTASVQQQDHAPPVWETMFKIEPVIGLITEYCDPQTNCDVRLTNITGIGSGTGVAIGSNSILTAGHVCISMFNFTDIVADFSTMPSGLAEAINQSLQEGEAVINIVPLVIAYDYYGDVYEVSAERYSLDPDLCLLSTDEPVAKFATLAEKMPKIGDRVYNIAAPYGIFTPGAAIIFDGFFAGYVSFGSVAMTINTQPGSSGSPVFNQNGAIVAIIHTKSINLERLGYGTDIYIIHDFLQTPPSQTPSPAMLPVHE